MLFLEIMQQIARAWNLQSYWKSVESLKKIKLYNGNPNVTEYCEKVWLSCSEHWLQAFRVQQAVNIVNTNNGIEPKRKSLSTATSHHHWKAQFLASQ